MKLKYDIRNRYVHTSTVVQATRNEGVTLEFSQFVTAHIEH